jgi:stearoyl-CoA desaturase (Delta-9 desaturase)
MHKATMAKSATAAATTTVVDPGPPPLIARLSLAAGPLGPVWQPYYDTLYTILQMTLNLPVLCMFTSIYIFQGWYSGDLKLTIFMPLVAVFGMARVPLHRYFAHGAFKTSRPFQFVLAILGSMSLQGGVLWWASKHIRHHKHCDKPLDPHSPSQTSELYAWLGWLYYETHHDWAYLPQRLLTPEMLFINLIFFVPNVIVTWSLVPLVGKEWALFLCWVPACFGSLATTHANVIYHPVQSKGNGPIECITVNKERGHKGIGPLSLVWLAKKAPFLFEPLVGEAYHEDHHDFPRRAHRPGIDVPYLFVLHPLAQLGIVWDLQQPLSQVKLE